ncbi:MAG: hypothetical protein ACRCXA_07485 [Peptostreptococcaceae bacterium]
MVRRSLLIVIIAVCFISGCSINEGNITKTESGFDVPIVEVKNEDDKIEIARVVFEEYLKLTYENYLNDKDEKVDIIKDYKIEDISISENTNAEEYRVEITYDLQSIDGYVTVFETGNGEIKKDNWVKGKYQIIDIKKIDENKYTILEMYTG